MRILYPQLQAPVLTAAQEPEQVTESRWHQPWSEPVRFKIIPALAIVLYSTSGTFAPTPVPEPGPAYESQYHQPWSEPVRFKRDPRASVVLAAASGPTEGIYASQLEPGKYVPWFAPFSEPVRVKPGLKSNLQQAWTGPTAPPTAPTILVSQWFANLSEPVRLKPRLGAGLNPFEYGIPQETIPIITADMPWFQWWSEPVRFKQGLRKDLQQDPANYVRAVPIYPYLSGLLLPLYIQRMLGYPASYWAGRDSAALPPPKKDYD